MQRRLSTPDREGLIKRFADQESLCKGILAIELGLILLLGWLVWNRGPVLSISLACAVVLCGAMGVFRGFVGHIFLKKKQLHELKPDIRFGVHTRQSLIDLGSRVFARLSLPQNAAPIFVTRAKDINAAALRCELWPGLRVHNGVYLNRSIIHLLDEQELESVVGHELGHVFPYAPILSRCYFLHSLLGGIASLWLAAWLAPWGFGLLAPILVLWVLERVIAWPWIRMGRGIEFLCDDHGALAAGLLPALSAEMKIHAENEVRQKLMLTVMEAKLEGAATPLHQLLSIYENAVPFGESDPVAVQSELKRLVASQVASDSGMSIRGFLDYLRGGNGNDQRELLNESINEIRICSELPLALEDRSPWLRGSQFWTESSAAALVIGIEDRPSGVLFREIGELDGGETTHPSVSRRVLFLWRHRETYRLRET